jgi:ABC-2 type transport system ATP-binding protein
VTADRGEVVIDVAGLRMQYGPFEAVRGIDLRVGRGEVFAFLGPNGAGKTTTVPGYCGFLVAADGMTAATSGWAQTVVGL